MNTRLSVRNTQSDKTALAAAIAACRRTAAPSRHLDAQIALAVFPALAGLPTVDEAIWLQEDGTRVRALRYSTARTAATTLVPSGCWIDTDTRGSIVCGAHGEWTGAHEIEAIALCIAALSARIAEAAHGD